MHKGVLFVSAEPNGGRRAEAKLCDNMIPRLEDGAEVDWEISSGIIIWHSLFLNKSVRWKNIKSIDLLSSRSKGQFSGRVVHA
jgi:hypothetical protein